MRKLNKEQERGVDLVIKSIVKQFDFIKGGQVSKDYEKYNGILFIDLFIDFFELSKLNNTEIMPFWVNQYEEYGKDVLQSTAIRSFVDETDFSKYYSLNDEIKNKLNTLYEFLPEKMMAQPTSLSYLTDEEIKKYPKSARPVLNVGQYQQYK